MWKIRASSEERLKIDSLTPELVIDEYQGPRIFTLRSSDGDHLLAYQCGEDDEIDRYLIVPANDSLINNLLQNQISIREALLKPVWAWIVDRSKDGRISNLLKIDTADLPDDALPYSGILLSADSNVFLRIRMIGPTLVAGRIPASVVKRAMDGATGTLKTLVKHVLSLDSSIGRPSEMVRHFYDLPTVSFAFRSFEVSFGLPEENSQLDIERDERETYKKVSELLTKGLVWASNDQEVPRVEQKEWSAIIEALSKISPPSKGPVQSVEVSGQLAGSHAKPVSLTRGTSTRIADARKFLIPSDVTHTTQGVIREFDKDKLTFQLRNSLGQTLRLVSFSSDFYEDAYLAFETDRPVTIVTEASGSNYVDLVSITFGGESIDLSGNEPLIVLDSLNEE